MQQHDVSLHTTLKQFVLGLLTDASRLRLEERLMLEPDVFEELEAVEAELIEDYANGELAGAEREAFQTHFLTTPERCQQADLVARLIKRASESKATIVQPAEERRFDEGWGWAWRPFWVGFAVATSLVAVGGLLLRQGSPREAPTVLRGGHEPASSSPAASLPSPLVDLDVPLVAGLLRDVGQLPRVDVPPRVATVHFRLPLTTPEYLFYRAAFYNADAEELWAVSHARVPAGQQPRELSVAVPSEMLSRGDYEVRLTGFSSRNTSHAVATYQFRVTSTPAPR